jgi:hypothetical protein
MSASEHPEAPRETDHVQEHRATPGARTGPPDHRSNRPAPPRDPGGPYVPDAGTFETFVGGAGI